MFSKVPTRSRASLLQRDGHEAARFFHRVDQAVEQFRVSPTNSPQPAIARIRACPCFPRPEGRLEDTPDRGPMDPPRVTSARQIGQIFLQNHFVLSSNRSLSSPRAIGRRETPVNLPSTAANHHASLVTQREIERFYSPT